VNFILTIFPLKKPVPVLTLINPNNAVDMDGTNTSILFNQYYYNATTPAMAQAASINVGTESDWTSTITTRDAYIAFNTALDGSLTEYMRLTSAGNLGIGVTSPGYKLDVATDVSTSYVGNFFNDGNNADRYGVRVQGGADDGSGLTYYLSAFDGDGGAVGYIQNNAGTFELAQESDLRLKTNVNDTSLSGLDVVRGLRVVDYNWLSNPEGTPQHGFIAQEAQEVFPEMVSVGMDGMLTIAQSKLIPVLTKAVQELSEQLEELRMQNQESSVEEIIGEVDLGAVQTDITAESINTKDLSVLGNALLAETTITGGLNIGMIQIDPTENSIDAVGTLKIQPLALGNIEIMGGLVEIDTEGKVLAAEIEIGKLTVSDETTGQAIIPAGETEVEIASTAISENSKVFTSLRKVSGNQALIVDEITGGEGFRVLIEVPYFDDILFDWWIVDTAPLH